LDSVDPPAALAIAGEPITTQRTVTAVAQAARALVRFNPDLSVVNILASPFRCSAFCNAGPT
jgi:hypothetical protein